jgi:hypothetical protein
MIQYNESSNTGLMTTFKIVNGKFEMKGGVVKCQDNLRMLIVFGGWFRLMRPDFCVNLYWLLQKPASWLKTFKVVILGRFQIAAEKYAPFVRIQKSDIFYDTADRKEVNIGIEYTYSLDKTNTPKQIVETLS